MTASRPFALVDLYFPAHAAPPEEVQAAADRAGLDAVVLVADDLQALPPRPALAALSGRARLHTACAVAGPGYRFALLAPDGLDALPFDAVDASGDPKTIQAAAHALGGVALPVSPRQTAATEVERQVPPLPADHVGVVALVAAGSRLGRDLDIEDAGIAERRILAGTGPFGQLADLGRYATLLPARADDLTGLVGALQRGLGTGVELGPRRPPSGRHRRPPPPDPHEGREDEAPQAGDDAPDKKRRRRRRRGRGKGEGGGAGGTPPPAAE
jgi:hypothetical protein